MRAAFLCAGGSGPFGQVPHLKSMEDSGSGFRLNGHYNARFMELTG
jgi:hypothetical protein